MPGAVAKKFDVGGYGKKETVKISEDFYIKKHEIPNSCGNSGDSEFS